MSQEKDVLKRIKQEEIEFVDMRFTDTKGKEQHVSLPADSIDESFFSEGKMFDGSSIAGWKGINESDMILMPDASSVILDPFFEAPTLQIRCDVLEPQTLQAYERDPRSIAKRAENYMRSLGIADACYFGPEPEFFIFDDVRFSNEMHKAYFSINSEEAAWSSGLKFDGGNLGHRPGVKGGYFPVPPVDSLQDIRSTMCQILKEIGQEVEVHHHEVGTAGQCEIGTKFDTLVNKADQVQSFKYVVHNVAEMFGKTATFMPKPLAGDNGSGMHVHQSLVKDGKNLFAGGSYAGLSDEALYYIGGIIKHAKAINAFANPSTNSYKRLVPGFEAPVLLAYSARNRSASIRIPYVMSEKARRIEVRFGDPAANPYLMFSSMLMAGLDGIQNQIHPGDAMDKNLYDLPPEELENVPTVASSLDHALHALDADRDFLTQGGVFSDDLIDAYIDLKSEESQALNMAVSPLEFEMYYSV
ncbi:glutamate--ammonia ligase [Thiotrichales bacterium 19S11-10]|nr:glutamate--ammonia ligase [Thiotrichales bacterium 19S11-10]